MAATITATPNPVGIWGDTATRTIPITWSTDGGPRARLYILVSTPPNLPLNETLFDGNPATGDRTNSKGLTLTVKVGSTYSLVLRQVNNNAVVATLVVTVVDLLEESAKQAAAAAALWDRIDPPQAIHNLRIQAGIDTVRVAFKTVQPTVPVIRVLRLDGTEVDASFALGAGMQTSHQAVLGLTSPLDLGTEFEVRILASGHNHHGMTVDVKTSHTFTTGTRSAVIDFTEINVLRDGDPGIKGDGDFTFLFGAGDADAHTNLGEPWPKFEQDINDDDPPVGIRKQIHIPLAPRLLWISVVGIDDDDAFPLPFTGFSGKASKPGFEPAGTGWASDDNDDRAWVTQHINIGDAANGDVIDMFLVTGNFGVSFTVRGRILVETQPGHSPVIFNLSDSVSAAGGLGKLVANGGSSGLPGGQPAEGGRRPGMLVARGADGATYRKVQGDERKQRRDTGWALVAPAIAGPLTALAAGSDRLALFALDAEGAVLHAEVAGKRSDEAPPAKWRKLGGRFTGAVIAVALSVSIELLACDDAGAVYHLTLPVKGGKPDADWRRIGECLNGEIKAVSLGKDTFAVFALDRRGAVQHRIHRNGRWQKEGWQVIAGATGVQLGAASASVETGSAGVVLALIGEDQKLHTLAWRDYPAKQPERWVAQGDFQAWLTRSLKPRIKKASEKKPQKKPPLKIAAE